MFSKSSSASPTHRRRRARSAGPRPSRPFSIPSPSTSAAPVSTRPTTDAAAASGTVRRNRPLRLGRTPALATRRTNRRRRRPQRRA